MFRLAYSLVSNSAEAEELVQDGFIAVYRRLDEIHKPSAYLRASVVNRCRSVLRHRRVMALNPPEPPGDLPDSAAELSDVLARLPENQRIAIVLRYYWRYPASEIARIVDMPVATVRSHTRRGLATLRKELEP